VAHTFATASGTAAATISVTLPASYSYAGRQIVLSILGWDADTFDNVHYQIVLAPSPPSAVTISTSQITRRVNFNYLTFSASQYNSRTSYLLGQASFLFNAGSFQVSSASTALTLPKVTGSSSLLIFVGISGMHYGLTPGLIPLSIGVQRYNITNLDLLFTPSGDYKFFNASVVLFNAIYC
jgi:hypothetical protein